MSFELKLNSKLMESQIENTYSKTSSRLFCLGEILLVFLPALLIINSLTGWIGQDPIRSMTVFWVVNVLMLILVWTGLKLRGSSWSDFGLTFKPITLKESLRVVGLSIVVFVIGVGGYLIGTLIMTNITGMPEAADLTRYDFLKDHLGWLLLSLVAVYIVSSFGEEVIYRAFLINRITELIGSTKYSGTLAVVLSSIAFGLIHYTWGPVGIVQTGFMGLAMGICYLRFKRRLWVLILAHAYMDTLLLVQIYLAGN